MADFYKLDIGDWNVGTDNLTLEQEAAYLRVVNAIRLVEQPIRRNMMVLGGLWRCNDRKAKRLLSELIECGKLTVEDGFIHNRRAVEEASVLRRAKVGKRSAGSRGGIESANSRRKPLENNDQGEKPIEPEQSRAEQSRAEHKEVIESARESASSPLFAGQQKKAKIPKPEKPSARDILIEVASPEAVDSYMKFRKAGKAKGTTERAAGSIAKKLLAIRDRGGNPDEALDMAQVQGWQGMDADWYFNKKGQGNGNGNSENIGNHGRGLAGTSKATEIADRATRYAESRAAVGGIDRDAGSGKREN